MATRLLCTVCILLFLLTAAPQTLQAQEAAASPKQQTDDVTTLRQQLEEQRTQINQLQQSLKQQAELIERQQGLLVTLQQKIEPSGTATPAPTPAVAETSAVSAQAGAGGQQPAAQAKPKPTPTPPSSVEAGFGKIRFNGLLQGWFSGGNGGTRDTFRIRRTELRFSGQITPEVRWTVMFDPAKALSVNNTYTTVGGTRVVGDTSVNQGSRILQDAFITLSYFRNATIDVGQYKIPLTLEGLQSSAQLDTVERALFMSDRSRGGGLGDIRDFGATVRGPITKYMNYQVGLFNGSGENQNDLDRNDQKAVIGRFVVRPPFIRGLQVGTSGAWGGNGQRPDRPRRDRLGAEALFMRDRFTFKSEVMSGVDADVHRLGYYTHFGYRIAPKVEAIFRFDSWDPVRRLETNAANVTERDYVTGFNYFILENRVKFQFNYLRKTFADGIVPSRNVVMMNLQTSW